jgi:hypothetical protein
MMGRRNTCILGKCTMLYFMGLLNDLFLRAETNQSEAKSGLPHLL